MLPIIVQHTPTLSTFMIALQLSLSCPQRDHVLNVMAGLIVGQGRKTLSDLCRLRVEAPDPSAVADFLRQSPWDEDDMQARLQAFVIEDLLARGGRRHGTYRVGEFG